MITGVKMDLSPNALKVLEKRYLKKDENGTPVETPEDLFRRVAHNISSADLLYDNTRDIKRVGDEFYEMMANLEFLPNSPTLMNAGKELQQLSACFVLPIEDSMESIFQTLKDTALIHKSGGGTGFSFSRLRPKNDMVQSTRGISSGPLSFMAVFDGATEAIKQGGTRRGANMGILRVDHPDIVDFIVAKEKNTKLNNFNISVALTKEFMNSLDKDGEYELINPHTHKVVKHLKARKVMDKIIEQAWKNGEPGIVFLDRLNKDNPTPKLGEIESTNPCGEQPLLPYESCNLGSINLSKMVVEINGRTDIDYDKLAGIVEKAIHFLDNVIDMNKYPIKKIEEMTKGNRKVGLGVMGFADMLLKLSIPYNSEEAVELGGKLMKFISHHAKRASSLLAVERGVFPNFEGSIYDTPDGLRLRNATTTTIAPTGTLSIIANCSSGIEPVFGIVYIRNVMDKNELLEINPVFQKLAQEAGFYSEDLMRKIAKEGGIHNINEVPENIRRVFVTAHDIAPEWHIRMQAGFQAFTDNAVSKTVNFPHEATKEDIARVYLLAYKSGCKGVTVYRDRSREDQVLNIEKVEKVSLPEKISPRPRPAVTVGTTSKITTGCGNLYVTINEDDKGLPFEVFTQMGKAGGCAASQLEAVGRLLSLALRSGIEIKSVIEQLRGIRCPSPSWEKGGMTFSCADAIAKVIEKRLSNNVRRTSQITDSHLIQKTEQENLVRTGNVVGVCPDCGNALIHESGCMVCKLCGFSKCS
jgi:ribonucleoside-diphosphate reductase alpha chain